MEKKYQIIYADPPWKQLKGGLRKCRPSQNRVLDYKTMELSDIKKIIESVPKEPNHVIFLWTIDKFLHEAEALLSDYKLHARIIWDKENGVAPAFTVRYSHEYLLWLYHGKFIQVDPKWRGKYTTVLREPSTIHSRKPVVVRNMINNLFPTGNRIELFAREKTEGWDVWGDEVESDIIL